MKILYRLTLFLLLFSLVFTMDSAAQDKTQDPNAENVEAFQKMLDFVGETNKLTVTINSSYDVRQASGQLLEFGGVSTWYIQRPNKVRVTSKAWDGDVREFYFDGTTITFYNREHNVYATAEKPGTIDQAFDYFLDVLDMPLPLAELFSEDHPFNLNDEIKSSMYLGESTIDGVKCNEYAFRSDEIDLQLWIKQKDPLPKRFVITYTNAAGEPQYRSQFTDWNLSADTPESMFNFTPPKDAEKIQFRMLMAK